jgi:hypothetical protein
MSSTVKVCLLMFIGFWYFLMVFCFWTSWMSWIGG